MSPRMPNSEDSEELSASKRPDAARDGSGAGPGLPPGIGSRAAALDLLRLTGEGRTLDDALETCRSFAALEGSDRGFARAIASTTLRRRGTLDGVIDSYLREPLKRRQAHIRDILRITAAQLCLMDTEAHAAAWSAVELAKLRAESQGYTKLVNAVARRMAQTGKAKAEGAALRADTPGWLWRRLARAHGAKTAGLIAGSHRKEPPLDLSLKDPDAAPPWPEDVTAQRLGRRTVRMRSTRVAELPGYEEGAFWVQDLAASLPADILAPAEGSDVLDLCAAPGGKTMQLAALGARVTAVDSSEMRLRRLERNLARTGLAADVVQADVLTWEPRAAVSHILLDAPCSATGTIRRNPDLLWTSREDQLPGLTRLQAAMLDRAADFLRPGGHLVYAVCSLLPEEGEEQVEALLARRDDMRRVPITGAEVGGLPVLAKSGDVRCLPHRLPAEGGMDGFFISRLEKTSP